MTIAVVKDFARQMWCRVVYGHLMVNLGSTSRGVTLWMCARCHRCEALDKLVDDRPQVVVSQCVTSSLTAQDVKDLRRYAEQCRMTRIVP